jgi:hypothetical protein
MKEKENLKKEVKNIMNIKDKIKIIWKKYKKIRLIFLSGVVVGINTVNWILFFLGLIDLRAPIAFTIFTVILVIFTLLSKSKYKQITAKAVYIVLGGIGLGGILWFFTGYIFIAAPWAPLRVLNPILRGRIFLALLFVSWGACALIMYFIGKKRNWRTTFTVES